MTTMTVLAERLKKEVEATKTYTWDRGHHTENLLRKELKRIQDKAVNKFTAWQLFAWSILRRGQLSRLYTNEK